MLSAYYFYEKKRKGPRDFSLTLLGLADCASETNFRFSLLGACVYTSESFHADDDGRTDSHDGNELGKHLGFPFLSECEYSIYLIG